MLLIPVLVTCTISHRYLTLYIAQPEDLTFLTLCSHPKSCVQLKNSYSSYSYSLLVARRALTLPLPFATKNRSVIPSLSGKSLPFRRSWSVWAYGENPAWMDVTHHIPNIWKINVPHQLRELLWKEINGSLPLGNSWTTRIQIGQPCPCNNATIDYRHVWVSPRCKTTNGLRAIKCRCGATVSLAHIWKGCTSYDMSPFRETARALIKKVVYLDAPTTDPDRWMSGDMWFPLISLRTLEHGPAYDERERKILGPSRKAREWIMGAMLWFTWRMRMKESHSPTMVFTPRNDDYIDPLREKCNEYKPTAKELRYTTKGNLRARRQRN